MRCNWLRRTPARRCPTTSARLHAGFALEDRVTPANVLTYHNDIRSNGVNDAETLLTRTNVNSTQFGKLWQVQVAGQVYAQPLVMQGVNITTGTNQGVHDVVFVATQHDQLYAFDAAAATPTLLWQRDFLDLANPNNHLPNATALTTVPQADVFSSDITVEIGITGTPVIDAATNSLYVIAKTKETVGGTAHYVQRLHRINLSNGTDTVTPFLIGDTTGSNTNNTQIFAYSNANGAGNIVDPYFGTGQRVVQFNALKEHQRPALTLVNGVIYTAWASHGDNGPYHGWMVGFDAADLHLRGVLCTTPTGGLGGIWMAGGALSYDGTFFYCETGNGTFSPGNGSATNVNPTAPAPGPLTGLDAQGFPTDGNYGDSFLKIGLDPATTPQTQNKNGWGLKVVDYFTPFNEQYLDQRDLDVGSSAAVVVPDQYGSSAHPHLLIGSGKEGVIYLIDRDNMGKFGLQNNIVQNTANQLSGSLDTAAIYNGRVYYVEGYGGTAKTFTLANGALSAVPETRSNDSFAFAGSTPSISSNGLSNGIVWDIDRGTNQLRAYSSDSYAVQLYNSDQAANGRDALGAAVKFQVPTVANGRVYVGSGTGDPNNFFVVYGLITPPVAAPAAPSNLSAQPVSSTQINLTWTNNAVSPNLADGFYVEQSPTGNPGTWTQVAVAGGTSYSVGGLTADTTYFFRIRAFNAIGTSAYTAGVSATTSNQGNAINYPNGFAGVPAGGALTFVGGAAVVGNVLRLTNGGTETKRAAYATNQQTITAFTTTFTYTKTGAADGATFVIHRDPRGTAALATAGGGSSLGYLGITPSFAFAMNIYQPNGYGTAFATNGTQPAGYTQAGVNFGADNSPITVTITYPGGNTLSVTMTQGAASQTKTFTFASTLANLVGGSTAYVGFTAATGGATSTQDITNWTYAALTPPAMPTNVQAQVTGYTAGSTQAVPLGVHLTWTAAAGASGYKIERKLTAGGTYQQVGTSNGTSFDDTGLATQANYFYRVRATNQVGDGAYSAEVSVTTPALAPTPTGGHTTAVTTTSVALEWTDNANNEDGFQIFRSVNGGEFELLTSVPANAPAAPSLVTYTDTGLTPGTGYDYHIQAFNLAGYSDFSGVSTETRTLAPTGLAATAVGGAINLTWAATAGADTYSVYRATTPGGQDATPLASGLTTPSYSDTSLVSGATYYYVVTATDLGGESARSNEASALASGATATATSLLSSANPSALGASVTFTATVSSAGGPPTSGSVQFFDGATPLGSPVPLAAGGVATLATSSLSAGTHAITAQYGGSSGFGASTSNAVNQVVLRAPRVASAAVNDGQGQRSLLRSVTLTFDGLVSFPAGNPAVAFQLTGPGAAGVTLSVDTSGSTATQTVARITFSGGSVVNGSLADGRYVLRVLANQVHDAAGNALDGNNSGAGGTDYVYGDDTATERLFRLFGDNNGDGTINAADFGPFRNAFGSSTGQAAYVEWLDIDGDGFINAFDFAQFRSRFGASIP